MYVKILPIRKYIVGVRLYVDDTLKCTYYFDRIYDPITIDIEYQIDEEPGLHSYRLEPIEKGEV